MGNSDSAAVQVERINLASSVEAPHFIGSWMIAPTSLCDDLVAFFEAHPENSEVAGSIGSVLLALGEAEEGVLKEQQGFGVVIFDSEQGVRFG